MISVSVFRINTFPIFRLAKDVPLTLEVVLFNKVFDVSITPTDKRARLTRAKRVKKRGIQKGLIDFDICTVCGEITIAGLCLNKRCTNSHV